MLICIDFYAINSLGCTQFMKACIYGHTEVVKSNYCLIKKTAKH